MKADAGATFSFHCKITQGAKMQYISHCLHFFPAKDIKTLWDYESVKCHQSHSSLDCSKMAVTGNLEAVNVRCLRSIYRNCHCDF